MRKGWESWDCPAWSRSSSGELVNIHKHLMGRTEPALPSGRTRGHGHKLEHRIFPLHFRRHFFPLRVTERWHRLPGEVAESLTLDTRKIPPDTVPGFGWPSLSGWLEQTHPRAASKLNQRFCGSVTTAQCCPRADLELPHWRG